MLDVIVALLGLMYEECLVGLCLLNVAKCGLHCYCICHQLSNEIKERYLTYALPNCFSTRTTGDVGEKNQCWQMGLMANIKLRRRIRSSIYATVHHCICKAMEFSHRCWSLDLTPGNPAVVFS